jgi:CheY-like chemotaxis protein
MPGPEAPARPLILVVEDEALVRMTLVGVLEDAGFKVIEAAHADEALRVLSAVSGIHAVVTDVEMPGTASTASSWPGKSAGASGRSVS